MLESAQKVDPCFWLVLVLCIGYTAVGAANGEYNAGVPCVYQGRLTTEKVWFGFLANLTIMNMGRIKYEFSYPADRCCQNVLFYTESQVSIINSRMNCWQKEALLRPEEDQILRLTPRFKWSGCIISYPNTVPTYTCHGGRSFTTDAGEGLTTYYIAICNCASLDGLDLQYWIELVGHVGECKSQYTIESTAGVPEMDTPVIAELNPGDTDKLETSEQNTCVIEGSVNTLRRWYGFLANITFAKGGGFHFKFSYEGRPLQKQHVILYNEADVNQITPDMKCWQRQYGIISPKNVPDQIIDLGLKSSWNGCTSTNISSTLTSITCQSTRRFDNPRKVFIAVSGCGIQRKLTLDYRFEVFGYEGNLCSAATAIRHPRTSLLTVMLSITVMWIMQNRVLGGPSPEPLWQGR